MQKQKNSKDDAIIDITEDSKKDVITDGNEKQKQEEDDDPMAAIMQSNKMMSWMMPIISISIAFVAPLGLALYWLVSNLTMIAERIIIDKVVKS